MITTSIVFDHRAKSGRDVTGMVEVRITVNRRSYYVSTGVKVERRHFVGGSVVDLYDSREKNERIRIMHARIQEEANRCLEEGAALNVSEVRRRARLACDAALEDDNSLIAFVEEQTGLMGLRPGTAKHYATLCTRLREYGMMTRISDVTVENLCRWDAWLHTLKCPQSDAERKAGAEPRTVSDAAVYNYHKCLKAVLNRAVLFGRIVSNPYERLRGKFSRGDRGSVEFLTDDEMAAVESLHPVSGTMMAVARDLFVFQMHTGLSYADTQVFDFSQYREVNGKWVVVGHRVKTGVQYVAMLTDECMDILSRYGMTLPKLGNADYNHCLKALGMAAGVSTPLHSHLARHSFATRAKALGVDIANISRMLGHASVVQTQRYAKVQPEQVFADLREIERRKRNT